MFRLIKVLIYLCKNDDALNRMERLHSEIKETMDQTVKSNQQQLKQLSEIHQDLSSKIKKAEQLNAAVDKTVNELHRKIKEEKTAVDAVLQETQNYDQTIQSKLLEIQKCSQDYLRKINSEIQTYENNVSRLGAQITE